MTGEEGTAATKELARRYLMAVNEGRTDRLDEVVAEDVVNHDPLSEIEDVSPAPVSGLAGIRGHDEDILEAFPDAEFEIERLVAEDDLVTVQFTFTGTHEGAFLGVEPTGERVTQTGIHVYRIEDGKIAERWSEVNNLALLHQFGLRQLGFQQSRGD